MKKKILVLLLLTVSLAACTAGHNTSAHTPDANGHVAGFFMGLWHGAICPVTFFISLFTNAVHFYEVHNNGSFYNFGFVLGAGIIFGGGGRGSKKR
jgi:hypothetical protein